MFNSRKRPITPEGFAKEAVSSLLNSNTKLEMRKNAAISSFRQAANELTVVNDELSKNADTAMQMREFFDEHYGLINKAIEDNNAVKSRILDIIGE